ncbi:MAG: MFS transporter, partial [Gemmatimonadetes bacterium]|nr:MFS transporter [Gemmatimonadota bacterium]NIS29184.1 MFS transporter [Actinomycetota bacterium]NIU64585.1 MFS transporter [Actinomycetota bacterium]NIW26371.1 MFS transporter [Actinomycetota bacterium]NIX18939.1 MFS transporter [Actinomycetota bacterium]
LRANRPFRRLLAGQLVTNVGDSLYLVATLWLVYDLSGSTVYTGLAGFLLMMPQALQLFLGPFVDRWPTRRLLVAVQLVQATVVAAVTVLWAMGHLSVALLL